MKNLVIGVFLLFVGSIHAQECAYSLEGKVTDFHNGDILIGAVIEFVGEQKYAETDLNGNYKINTICEGTYTVRVTHPQCEPGVFEVSVLNDKIQNFKIEHHPEELREVTVTGEKYGDETNSSLERRLKTKTLEEYSGASLGDALQEISGVSSLNTGSTVVKPVIQGLHSSRIAIINNGTRLEDQEWGVEHAPNFDLNSAANVSVVKGAGALRYGGDAVGGVIIADSRRAPVKDTLFGKTIFNAASNGRGVGVTTSLTKAYKSGWYGLAQGTLKYAGDLEAPDYNLSNTGVRERDFSLGFGLNKIDYGFDAYYSFYDAEIGILRASHIGNVADLVRAINNPEPNYIEDFTYDINAPKQEVQHHLARISFFKRFENAGKLNLDYSFQRNNRKEFDIRRGDDRDKASLDLELTTHTVNTNFKWDSNPDFEGNIGIEGSYQVNFPDPNTGIRRLIPDYDMYTAAGYATLAYDISPSLTLDAGIRYDWVHIDAQKFYLNSRWEERGYQNDFSDIVVQELESQLLANPVFDYNNFSGTLGAQYTLSDRWSLRVNASSASRAPNPAELFSDGLHHSAAIIELGDLRIDPEQSYKGTLELAASYKKFNLSISPYYNHISDFIILEPNGLQFTNRGAFPVYEYSQVDARLFGIDIQGDYSFNKYLNLATAFAYVNGEDLDRERPLIDMPAPNWTNTFSYNKVEWNNLQIGIRSESVFKQNRFPNNNFDVTYVNSSGQEITEEVRVSETPAAYTLLHLNSSIDINIKSNSKLTLGFYIDNILNTEYRDYLNRQRYFVDDLGRNFRIQLKLNY